MSQPQARIRNSRQPDHQRDRHRSSTELGTTSRVALLPVVDLAGYTANTAFWLARAAANLEVAAARARLHAARPEPVGQMADRDPQPQRDASVAG
jgi:hypothetical protein